MSKKSFIIILFLISGMFIFGYVVHLHQKYIQHASSTVPLFEKFELKYPYTGNYSNPNDPLVVDVEGLFTSPSGKVQNIPGFYFQDFTRSGDQKKEILTPVNGSQQWEVRFAPSEIGTYTYKVTIKDQNGTNMLDSGTFTAVASNNPGYIRGNNNHLEFDNGQLFIALGVNAPWFQNNSSSNKWGDGTYGVDAMYQAFAASGANTFHLWTCSWNDGLAQPFARPDIACNSTTTTSTQMSQPDSWEMDYMVDQAHAKNIYIIPVLKHKDQANFDPGDAIYIRYFIARWGYSPNILALDTFKEGAYKLPPVTQYLSALQQADPYHHLISASEGNHASANPKSPYWQVMAMSALTLTQNHDYSNDCNQPYDNDAGLYAVHVMLSLNIRKLNKPSFFGESGVHQCGPDGNSDVNGTVSQYVPMDTQGRILRSQIWGEFLSTAGGISVWNQMAIANISAFKGLSAVVQKIPSAALYDQTVPFSTYDSPQEILTSDQKLQVIGRKSSDFAIIRAYNTTGTWAAILRDHITNVPISGIVTLSNMRSNASFTVEWIDTVSGNVLSNQTVSSSGSNLQLSLPQPLKEDIAAVILSGNPFPITPTNQPTGTGSNTPTSSPIPSISITPTITNFPSPSGPTGNQTPTPTSSQFFCGQSCSTDADCNADLSHGCGVCDANGSRTCVSALSLTQPASSGSPSPSPAISLSPTSSTGEVASLEVHFEGIDSANNQSPIHPQRLVNLYFYKSQNFANIPDFTIPTTVSYSPTNQNGLFINSAIDLSAIPQGSYYVLLKSSEGSLREVVSPQLITIGPSQQIQLNGTSSFVNLRLGDLNNDNSVDIHDYNILVDCFGLKQKDISCSSHNLSDSIKGLFADLNDDGVVNGIDYNILIRHLGENGF